MRTLDRYVARYFLSSFALCGALLCLLFVVVDSVVNVNDLLEAKEPFLLAALHHYGALLPLLFQRFGAFVTLAGGLFAAARLQSNNELVPILASGVSVFRCLAPILVGALAVGGAEAAITELVIPRFADEIRSAGLIGKSARRPGFLRDDYGNVLFAGRYDARAQRLYWVTFRERGLDGQAGRTVVADRAIWEPAEKGGRWRLEDGWVERPRERAEPDGTASRAKRMERIPKGGIRIDTTIIPIDIESLNERLSLLRLGDLLRQAYERQTYLLSLRVQVLQRLSGPLAHVVLCLLGLPFVLQQEGRKSLAFGLLALLAICAGYFLSTFFCYEFGARGTISPFWAAMAPTIGSGLLALVAWRRVRT